LAVPNIQDATGIKKLSAVFRHMMVPFLLIPLHRSPLPCLSVRGKTKAAACWQPPGGVPAGALGQLADMMAIGRFGFRTGRDMDKFEGIPCKEDAAGMPYPTATACAHYSCKVEQTVDLGTHLLFVGLAEESEILTEDEPLTYSYYRNVIKGLTPKGAPSYQAKK